MRHPARQGAPIVVKVGSSSLSAAAAGLDPEAVERVAANVDAAWTGGHPTVLVTSGAIVAGLPAMGLEERPADIPGLQVAAAVGQSKLMAAYASAFAGRQVGQVLLTRDVLARRDQYLHARAALERMLGLGVVPIVNENDSVVVDEVRLGDNDTLAAIVSHLVGAGMMILLTDTPGIYSNDPWTSDDAELLGAVRHTDEVLDEVRLGAGRGTFGSGGIATKIAAARMAAWSGIPTVVASAAEPDVVKRALGGEEVGTWVEPRDTSLTARKLWIAFGKPSEGRVDVDDGAARALVAEGRSLLPVGVTKVEGDFASGSAIEVHAGAGLIAKGIASISSRDIGVSLGQHSSVAGGEVVHRDDLVVLA